MITIAIKTAILQPEATKKGLKITIKNILMLQQSNQLVHTNSSSKESMPMNSRSVVSTDINNDGKLDILIRNPKEGILFTNSNTNKNNWIKVKLIGKKPNTYAINAVITLRLSSKTLTEIILPQTGYLSQEPYIKHFGVGKEAHLRNYN